MDLPRRRQKTLSQVFTMFNQLRDPARRSWILLNPTSLGDTMMVCALLHAFREKHGAPVTMVIPEKQMPLAQMFAHRIERIVTLSAQQLEALCIQLSEVQVFCMDQPWIVSPLWHGDGRWEHFSELFRYPKRGGLAFADIYRHVMHLDWDAPIDVPVIPDDWRKEAEQFAASVGMVPGKSAILFPNNNSNPELPDPFWQALANQLVANGLKVFTNMAGNAKGPRQTSFQGTTEIKVPLKLAVPLMEIAGRFISGNNGLIVTAMLANVRSEGSILISNKPFVLNSYEAKDPIPWQSLRYVGIPWQPFNEYLVVPDKLDQSLIAAIAANDKAAAFVW